MTGGPASCVRSIPRFQRNYSPALLVDALRTHGAAIVERDMEAERLEMARRQLEPWFDASLPSHGGFYGAKTRRFSALFAKAPVCDDLAGNPAIVSAGEALLRGDPSQPRCDCIQLHLTQAIAIDPGERAQVIHRDTSMFPVRFPFEIMLNVMWTIDDFTQANGATRIVPRSHGWDIDRRPREEEICIAEAPAGSAIIWAGGTLHGGGANSTTRTRRGVVFSYSLGWLAQAEKLLLSVPPETARRLSPQIQKLIGYQVHRPNLGWVEGRDPVEWLKGETGELAQARDLLTEEAQQRMERLLASEAELVE